MLARRPRGIPAVAVAVRVVMLKVLERKMIGVTNIRLRGIHD